MSRRRWTAIRLWPDGRDLASAYLSLVVSDKALVAVNAGGSETKSGSRSHRSLQAMMKPPSDPLRYTPQSRNNHRCVAGMPTMDDVARDADSAFAAAASSVARSGPRAYRQMLDGFTRHCSDHTTVRFVPCDSDRHSQLVMRTSRVHHQRTCSADQPVDDIYPVTGTIGHPGSIDLPNVSVWSGIEALRLAI